MRKIFIMAFMTMFVTSAFAQDISKQIAGAKSYDEAMGILTPALNGMAAADKAKAYNSIVDLVYPKAEEAFKTATMNQVSGKESPYETISTLQSIKAAMECEKYDNEPNEKGKVKPKFHKANQGRLTNSRLLLIYGGQNASQANDNALAYDYYSTYVESALNPLFKETVEGKDQNLGQVARVAAYMAANNKDYKVAEKYINIAMADTSTAKDAEEVKIYILQQQLHSKADTLNYISELKKMNASKYFATIASLYNQIGEKATADKMINDQLAANPKDKMAWAIKGEGYMNDKKWDEAIDAFKKTIEIDPNFLEVYYNLGVCSSSKGFDLNQQLSDKMGHLSAANTDKVRACLNDAKTYYEKVRELDPNREKINWAPQLRMIYNALGDKAKADEISAILGDK